MNASGTALREPIAAPALRRVGLGHLAGGDSPLGSRWNGCVWAAETLNGVVNHARGHCKAAASGRAGALLGENERRMRAHVCTRPLAAALQG